MNNKFKYCAIIVMLMAVCSCVPVSKLNEMSEKKAKCDKERDELKGENDALKTKLNEMTAEIEKLNKIITPLIDDTALKGKSFRSLTLKNNDVLLQYEDLYKNFEKLKKEYDDREKKISGKLSNTTDDLLKREDEIKKMERSLQEQKNKLDAIRRDLDSKDLELKTKDFELKKQNALLDEKNKKLTELQNILNRKDSVVKALKDKVSGALTGFVNDGLSVNVKNGKVYVSLDEKLLFKPAKWDVDPKGKEALKKLSKVLEQNSDINVNIEGHTDNVPYNGSSGIEDNWDLSAKRATSIIKIILKEGQGIEARRLSASGRAEHAPVDKANTSDARQKNRRTEIILTPKLDELFKILE